MKIYAISGLGADKRLFNNLNLDHEIVYLDWESHQNCKDLKAYSKRFLTRIDISKPFVLMGVSFGGMICSELSNWCNPAMVILISSAENKFGLPNVYRMAGKADMVKLFPKSAIGAVNFSISEVILKKMFGSDSLLLSEYIKNVDADFVKWAAQIICTWQNKETIQQPKLKIKGNKDHILPSLGSDTKIIKNAGHFVVYENAQEVSAIINTALNKGN